MNDINDGGPAFPAVESGEEWSDMKGQYVMRTYSAGGMSLRDYFAAHAPLPSEQMLGGWVDEEQREAIQLAACVNAYRWADAMLKAREAK